MLAAGNARLRKELADRAALEAAQQAATALAAANGKRPRSDSLEEGEILPNKDRNRQVDQAIKIDHHKLRSFQKRCVLKVFEGPFVGSFDVMMGLRLSLYIEGGRHGNPEFSLRLRCHSNPAEHDKPVQDHDSDFIVFRFRPGVVNWDGEYELISYERLDLASSPHDLVTFPDEQFGSLSNEQKKKIQAFKLTWNGDTVAPGSSKVRKSHWKPYGKDVMNALRDLMKEHGSITVYINWAFTEIEMANINAFEQSYRHRLSPLYQYRSDHGRGDFQLGLDNAETIREVGDGMLYIETPIQGSEQKMITYYYYPVALSSETLDELTIPMKITAIREFQQLMGQRVYTEELEMRALLIKAVAFKTDNVARLKSNANQRLMQDTYFAYIRMIKGKGETVPVEGTVVDLSWDNAKGVKTHEDRDEDDWYGEVVRANPDNLKDTQTDFCVMLIKPYRAAAKKPHDALVKQNDQALHKCFLRIKVNQTPAKRELAAIDKFASTQHRVLIKLKESLMSPKKLPPAGEDEIVNFALGPSNADEMQQAANELAYQQFLRHAAETEHNNESQTEVLTSFNKSPYGMNSVIGPAGTGKSHVTRQVVWNGAACGHQVLVYAQHNQVLDKLTNDVAHSRPSFLPDKKLLRSETDGVSNRTDLNRGRDWAKNYLSVKPEDVDMLEDPPVMWEEDPMFVAAMDAAFASDAFVEEYADFERRQKMYMEAHAMHQETEAGKRRGVSYVVEAQMGYRIAQLVQQDLEAAQLLYDKDLGEAKKTFAGDRPALDRFVANLTSAKDRSLSKSYVEHKEYYHSEGGRVSRKSRSIY